MLIYVAGSYTWTQKLTIFDFNFELRFLANSSPSPEKLSKPPSCILIHDASLCIIMMILIHDSWSWNTVNNESFCITMHHGHEPWCIVMYHDDQSPSTSTCSTFPDWGGSRAQRQTRNPHLGISLLLGEGQNIKQQKNLVHFCPKNSIGGNSDHHGWIRTIVLRRLH